jgi:hypothetical protein
MNKSDVKYRFVIDINEIKKAFRALWFKIFKKDVSNL